MTAQAPHFYNDFDSVDDNIPNAYVLKAVEKDFEERGSDEALAKLYGALAKARGSFGPIKRSRTVTIRMKNGGTYDFSYADMEELLSATTPALSANGLSVLIPFTRLESGVMAQRTIIAHESGARLVFVFKAHCADDDIKTMGGDQTYLTRYAYRSVLVLGGGEDLDDMPQESVRGEQGATVRDKRPDARPETVRAQGNPPAQSQRPTPQPQPAAKPDARLEEMKAALRACGYLTVATAEERITKALHGEIAKNPFVPGSLRPDQIDSILVGLTEERAAKLKGGQ